MELKVGLLNDSFPPTIDGVANAMANYAKVIDEKFGTPVVITPEYPHVIDNYNYEVYRYSSLNFRGKMPYRVGNPFSPKTIADLKKRNMDIMHIHCPFASSVLAKQLNKTYMKKNRIPTVFTYHTKFDVDIDKFVRNPKFNKIVKKWVLNNISSADEVWAVSNGAAENLKDFGYKGDILVMPNGTDFPKGVADPLKINKLNNLLELEDNVPVFLFVGRMMWYKNLKLIIDSLKIVSDAGIKFKALFVGDGVDRPTIVHYAKNIGLGEKTEFLGAVYDREKLRVIFSRADLFLFPSTYDTSGLVVKEAAACDCAALLIKGSCAAEGIVDGVTGLLADENPESCAKKIIEAARGENAFKKLGSAAGEKVYYSWEQAVTLAYNRYEEIMKERHR